MGRGVVGGIPGLNEDSSCCQAIILCTTTATAPFSTSQASWFVSHSRLSRLQPSAEHQAAVPDTGTTVPPAV